MYQGEFEYEDEIIPDESESIQTALEDNFSIRSMQIKLKVDEAFIALDRADYWPTLQLSQITAMPDHLMI
jgi:outer membrane protein TolC